MSTYPTIDSLIAQQEGFGKPGTIATNQNNPGNIIWGDWAAAHGAVGPGVGNKIAVFPSSDSGFAAEDALVGQYAAKGATVGEMISAWAPPSENDTQSYIDFLSKGLGVDPNTPVSKAEPAAASTGSDTPSRWDVLKDAISFGNPALAAIFGTNPMGGKTAAAQGVGFSWGRIGAFILGFIVIAGALYLFKPVQEVVKATGRVAMRVAAI